MKPRTTRAQATKGEAYDPSTVIGSTGLKQYGGFVTEEFLPELKGLRGVRAYRAMADNDATVGAVIFAITTLIRQAKWNVQAVDDTPEAEAGKVFVEQVIHDMAAPWSSVVGEACSMFTYGFAPMEVTYKVRAGRVKDPKLRSAYDDGRIGIRSVALRAQPTVTQWEFDPEDGSVTGLWQQPYFGPQVFIPIEKLALFRTTDEKNNPEGRSVLRTAYRSHYFKTRIEEIEAIGVERDMAGLPVAYIPASFFATDATPTDKRVLEQWQKLVTQIRQDKSAGIVLPSDRDQSGNLRYDLKLLSTAGSRTFDTTKIVDRYDRAIATSVLADFIFLGQQAVGSFALSSDKTALFATAVGAFARAIADTANAQIIAPLWELNAFPPEFMPKLVCGDLEHANLAELATFIQTLTGAGAQLFPDRDLENHLRELAGLPPAPEDDGMDDEGYDADDTDDTSGDAEDAGQGAEE